MHERRNAGGPIQLFPDELVNEMKRRNPDRFGPIAQDPESNLPDGRTLGQQVMAQAADGIIANDEAEKLVSDAAAAIDALLERVEQQPLATTRKARGKQAVLGEVKQGIVDVTPESPSDSVANLEKSLQSILLVKEQAVQQELAQAQQATKQRTATLEQQLYSAPTSTTTTSTSSQHQTPDYPEPVGFVEESSPAALAGNRRFAAAFTNGQPTLSSSTNQKKTSSALVLQPSMLAFMTPGADRSTIDEDTEEFIVPEGFYLINHFGTKVYLYDEADDFTEVWQSLVDYVETDNAKQYTIFNVPNLDRTQLEVIAQTSTETMLALTSSVQAEAFSFAIYAKPQWENNPNFVPQLDTYESFPYPIDPTEEQEELIEIDLSSPAATTSAARNPHRMWQPSPQAVAPHPQAQLPQYEQRKQESSEKNLQERNAEIIYLQLSQAIKQAATEYKNSGNGGKDGKASANALLALAENSCWAGVEPIAMDSASRREIKLASLQENIAEYIKTKKARTTSGKLIHASSGKFGSLHQKLLTAIQVYFFPESNNQIIEAARLAEGLDSKMPKITVIVELSNGNEGILCVNAENTKTNRDFIVKHLADVIEQRLNAEDLLSELTMGRSMP